MRHPGLRTAPLFPALAFFAVIVFASGLAAAESYTYIVVLHERVAAGETAEPDVEALGGEFLQRSRNRRVVRVPAEAARALAAHRAVSYMQRVQTDGEVPALPQSPMIASNLVATNDSTPPTWESGDYVYDGDGKITAIGADTYAYDSASRLVNASLTDGATQSEGYAYDSFGNLVETTRSATPSTSTPASKATNRLTNVTYDSAGNVATSESGTTQYFYDGFHMLRFMDTSAPGTGIYYVYTADDERVGVDDYGEKRWMIRDLSGKVLREWEVTNGPWWVWREDYVYRGGALVAAERETAEGGTRHFHIDHLGTARLITDQSSMKVSLHDYFPFGVEKTDFRQEMLDRGTHWPNRLKFTGHERDFIGGISTNNRNQLDYMHARYYSPVWGRFLAVDPVLNVKRAIAYPQQWNRYSYAINSPLRYVDPTGRLAQLPSTCANAKQVCKEVAALRNQVPVELRMFVRATTTKDGMTILDARYLNMMKGAASDNFQAMRIIANSPGRVSINASATSAQRGNETITLSGANGAMGLTIESRINSERGLTSVLVAGDLSARDTASTLAHELRHAMLYLIGKPSSHESGLFEVSPGVFNAWDPHGPVNKATMSAEDEANTNFDPFYAQDH